MTASRAPQTPPRRPPTLPSRPHLFFSRLFLLPVRGLSALRSPPLLGFRFSPFPLPLLLLFVHPFRWAEPLLRLYRPRKPPFPLPMYTIPLSQAVYCANPDAVDSCYKLCPAADVVSIGVRVGSYLQASSLPPLHPSFPSPRFPSSRPVLEVPNSPLSDTGHRLLRAGSLRARRGRGAFLFFLQFPLFEAANLSRCRLNRCGCHFPSLSPFLQLVVSSSTSFVPFLPFHPSFLPFILPVLSFSSSPTCHSPLLLSSDFSILQGTITLHHTVVVTLLSHLPYIATLAGNNSLTSCPYPPHVPLALQRPH
jgi:hypothetical protein